MSDSEHEDELRTSTSEAAENKSSSGESRQEQQQTRRRFSNPQQHVGSSSEGSSSYKAWGSISTLVNLLSRPRDSNNNNSNESEKLDEELACPICHDIMKEVFATQCGHSFCHECIVLHINNQPDCPLCRSNLTTAQIYPNFQLNRIASNRAQIMKEMQTTDQKWIESTIKDYGSNPLALVKALNKRYTSEELVEILGQATNQKVKTDHEEEVVKNDILCCFLKKLKASNRQTMHQLLLENQQIRNDLSSIKNLYEQRLDSPPVPSIVRKRRFSEIADPDVEQQASSETNDSQQEVEAVREAQISASSSSSSNNTCSLVDSSTRESTPLEHRVDERFDDFRDLYYESLNIVNDSQRARVLKKFANTIYQVTKYSCFRLRDSLKYTDSQESSAIVSSIEFDRYQKFFAVGGVTKEIKIYDYSLINNPPENSGSGVIHCPVRTMTCGSKISCLSWSPYLESQVADSDYDGVVDVWDINVGQKTHRFDEHTKRAWSVDICQQNPSLLASGSDDTTVKVWSLSNSGSKSVFTLGQKGNVCCAKFAPNNSSLLAIGSADHHVICYDLRNTSEPLQIYQGHNKAVSYVKWLNDNELVTASTDSTLKLWDRESGECKRTFLGHRNEKNFVGLSVNGDWISCGSENNAVYTYHKYSQTPVASYQFEEEKKEEPSESQSFVSSVCWKNNTKKLLAANSKGVIKLLQMK